MTAEDILMSFLVPIFGALFYAMGKGDFLNLAVKMLQEQAEEIEARMKKETESDLAGCEYCSGEYAEYQHTTNTKLYINTFGYARTIETECMPCPPYSSCCMRGIPARSAFLINYCPNCGRKLSGGADDAEE